MKNAKPEIKKVTAYVDGSCLGNPGPGGWGVVLGYGNHTGKFFGGEEDTTNNRMELMAAIQALRRLKHRVDITIITDSVYVRDGMTKWLEGWKKVDWKPKGRSAIKNRDLWQQLDELAKKHTVHWQWVKGHSANPGNELADSLARQGATAAKSGKAYP